MTRLRKRPRQQRACATWHAILDAAAQLFSEHGYAATSTNKVAERAGVSIGSLYQYFPNKDALLLALAERHIGEAGEELAATFTALEDCTTAVSTVPETKPRTRLDVQELSSRSRERPAATRRPSVISHMPSRNSPSPPRAALK